MRIMKYLHCVILIVFTDYLIQSSHSQSIPHPVSLALLVKANIPYHVPHHSDRYVTLYRYRMDI